MRRANPGKARSLREPTVRELNETNTAETICQKCKRSLLGAPLFEIVVPLPEPHLHGPKNRNASGRENRHAIPSAESVVVTR